MTYPPNELPCAAQFRFRAASGGRRLQLRSDLPLVLLLFGSLNTAISEPQTTSPGREKLAGLSAHAPDRLLIRPRLSASPLALERLHMEQRCTLLRHFPAFGGVQVLRVPTNSSVEKAIRWYQESGMVEYAEPDYEVRLASVFPDDPLFMNGTLWGLNNAGQDGGVPNADIDAPEAWSAVTCASNVIVAVVDSGIRYTHEDLASNMWVNPQNGSHGFNALNGSSDPNDDNGHGTLVAGVIGAAGNNGRGITGVAWGVKIMACKFIDSSYNGLVSDALACLDYARTNGAHIVNASWGLYSFSASLSNAITALRDAGVVLVAAAGNDTLDTDVFPYYPASFDLDNIVAVTATTRSDALYALANHGATTVDLAAPGYEIYSTHHLSNVAYAPDEGTSMAAAYASGALALLRSVHPTSSPAELIAVLMAAVDSLPNGPGVCVSEGRLNLRRSLGIPPCEPRLRISAASSPGVLHLDLAGDPGRAYAIEKSADFSTWLAVSTNLTDFEGSALVTNVIPNESCRQFFRGRLLD